jgi:hypothetical protein
MFCRTDARREGRWMHGSALMRRRSTKPWNARAGVPGFASAALFYRSLIHRLPLADDDRAALRAHQDIHEAIGRLEAGESDEEVTTVSAWLAEQIRRPASPGDSQAYTQARLELLSLLTEALSKSEPRAPEAAVFTRVRPG